MKLHFMMLSSHFDGSRNGNGNEVGNFNIYRTKTRRRQLDAWLRAIPDKIPAKS